MHINVRPTIESDIPALAQVMSDATLKKSSEGDHLWGDQPFTIDEITASYQEGGLYTVEGDGVVVGTVTLTETDERVWGQEGSDPTDALYIHKLATADVVRGQNVGEAVIDWVIDKARTEGRTSVRLDCSYTNRGLCRYYEKRGFQEVRRRDLPRKSTARDLRDPVYNVALFQRDVV